MDKELIVYEEATNALETLRLADLERDGTETPFTFDSKRAKDILSRLERYGDLVKPVRCKFCQYRDEVITYKDGKPAFTTYTCERIGKYLGDYGYCSFGIRRKERNDG